MDNFGGMQHERCSQITCNSRSHQLQCTYHGAGWTLVKTEDTLNRHQHDFPAMTTAVVTTATHWNRRVERVENVIDGVSAALANRGNASSFRAHGHCDPSSDASYSHYYEYYSPSQEKNNARIPALISLQEERGKCTSRGKE